MTRTFFPVGGNIEDSIAKKILEDLSDIYSADAVYMDSVNSAQLNEITYKSAAVFIMLRDQFVYPAGYNYYKDNVSSTVTDLEQLANKYLNKKFIVLCEFEGVTSSVDNLHFVNMGGKVVDDFQYKDVPLGSKNFNSDIVGVCLNRQMRPHRIALISLLYGLGLDEHISISAMHLYKQFNKINSSDLLDHLSWRFDPEHDLIRNSMLKGFTHIHAIQDIFKNSEDIYVMDGETCVYLNNTDNYNNKLKSIYNDSFVEIISESWYVEPYPFLTEKYLNSVYGQNFPIFIASPGYAKYVRGLGFDIFDDIIDHSYDQINDPIIRMNHAVIKNQHLFKDTQHTKEIWKQCQYRFEKNVDFAKSSMYNIFSERTKKACHEILTKQI